MPRISVALATYNGGKFLREQLDSIAAQSLPPDELVACDDGSTDDTTAILDDFASRVPFRVEVVRNPDRLGYARNFEKAVGLCAGEIVFPCDQDDVWKPAKLASHMALYDDAQVGLVVNDANLVDQTLRPLGKTWFEAVGITPDEFAEIETDRAFRVLIRESRLCGCMMSFRSRYWARLVPFPERIGHDDWVALALSLVSRLRVLREPLNDYRQHPAQVTQGSSASDPASPREVTPRVAKLEMRAMDLANMFQGFAGFEKAGEVLRFPSFREELKGQIGHYLRRSSMADRLSRRLPLILIEWMLGHYGRYTNHARNNLSYDLRSRFYR